MRNLVSPLVVRFHYNYNGQTSQNCPYLDKCKNVSLQRTFPFGHKLTFLKLNSLVVVPCGGPKKSSRTFI